MTTFTVNASILLTDRPLLERPAAVAEANFGAVEFWWPFATAVPNDSEVDAFVGALLARLVERGFTGGRFGEWLQDEPAIVDALRHAAAGGALATTRHGAFASMPDRHDIERLVATRA